MMQCKSVSSGLRLALQRVCFWGSGGLLASSYQRAWGRHQCPQLVMKVGRRLLLRMCIQVPKTTRWAASWIQKGSRPKVGERKPTGNPWVKCISGCWLGMVLKSRMSTGTQNGQDILINWDMVSGRVDTRTLFMHKIIVWACIYDFASSAIFSTFLFQPTWEAVLILLESFQKTKYSSLDMHQAVITAVNYLAKSIKRSISLEVHAWNLEMQRYCLSLEANQKAWALTIGIYSVVMILVPSYFPSQDYLPHCPVWLQVWNIDSDYFFLSLFFHYFLTFQLYLSCSPFWQVVILTVTVGEIPFCLTSSYSFSCLFFWL